MKIETSTIVRTSLLVVALVNQLLTATGHAVIPVDDATITNLITTAITVVAALWSWWKNNSFTAAAKNADEYLKDLKQEAKNDSI
ncbi:MAG: phage holin [Streptococcaceae bacterium]|jgi:SPP1 family holin|nr:phage holin [Streptococcaceae bacterium]